MVACLCFSYYTLIYGRAIGPKVGDYNNIVNATIELDDDSFYRVETYGGNSTMGFMDMLAQTYSKVDYDYEDALKYNYKEEHVKGIVDTMWSSNYNAIANCNYLLQNIEKKGSVMSERLRNVVEGEALALRAFLHFDLLRGYAPSYKMGKDEPAIPYVREVTNSPVVQSTVAEVLEYILTDLKTAQALLKPVDPIGPSLSLIHI